VTKRDYQLIASTIFTSRKGYLDAPLSAHVSKASKHLCVTALDNLAISFALQFGQENPRFDRDRFLIACGVPR
jgi:hypothetical protein